MHDDAEVYANTQIETGQRSRVHSKASLTLEIFGDRKDNQHKAQIISTSLLSYCTVV